VLVAPAPDLHSGTLAAGIVTLARHAGIDARFPAQAAYVVGAHHTVADARAGSSVVVAVDDAAAPYAADAGTYRSVAVYDPLTAAERAERNDLAREIHAAGGRGLDALRDWLEQNPAKRDRAASLDERGARIELFLQTP
jgi:hypothetical protein